MSSPSHQPLHRLPPEIKDLIIDELHAQSIQQEDLLGHIALVWKDAIDRIRYHRFRNVDIIVDCHRKIECFRQLLSLVRTAPRIAKHIRHICVFDPTSRPELLDLYTHLDFRQLLQQATKLVSVYLTGLSLSSAFASHSLLNTFISLLNITTLQLDHLQCFFDELIQVCQSFPRLDSVSFSQLTLYDMANERDTALARRAIISNMNGVREIACTPRPIRKLIAHSDSLSSCVFLAHLASPQSVFSHVQTLQFAPVLHSVMGALPDDETVQLQGLLDRYSSLKALNLPLSFNSALTDPKQLLRLPLALESIEIDLSLYEEMEEISIEWYTKTLLRHTKVQSGPLREVVIHAAIFQGIHKPGTELERLLQALDRVLALPELGVESLILDVGYARNGGKPKCRRKVVRKWILHRALRLTWKRFLHASSSRLYGTSGELRWYNFDG